MLVLHLALYLGLVLLALREFVFGSGYIIYHNIAWPLAPNALVPTQAYFTPGFWSGNGADPAGFTRAWIDAPPIWIGQAAGSTLAAQKAFYVYAFLVEYVLGFVAATLFLTWFPSGLVRSRREFVRLGFLTLLFVNPAALQWEAGGLIPFFWSVPILEIALFASLLGLRDSSLRWVLISGVILGVGSTFDPRTFVWGWLVLGPMYFLTLLVGYRKRIECIYQAAANFAIAIPGIALTFFAFSWNGSNQPTLRTATVPLLTWLSSNAGPLRLFELQGYFITEITYAPPSIFAYGAPGGLPAFGSPTSMVLPHDPVSALWLLALALIPVLAFGSLLFRGLRAYALPLGLVALGSLAFASGSQLPIPGFLDAQIWAGTLPVIGPVWQTVIGVPIYMQVVTEAVYVPMILLTIIAARRKLAAFSLSLEHSRTLSLGPALDVTLRVRRSPRPSTLRRARTVFTVVVVGALLFASWQFFTGSFYPAGYSVGASPTGVPSIGSTTPVTPPKADVEIQQALAADPAPYAVYWPGATGFTYAWSARSTPSLSLDSPKPVVDPPGIGYLVSHNLTADTYPLLTAAGVRFVIIDNMSSLELTREFGTSSLGQVVRFFESSPGLSLVIAAPPYTWEFRVTGSPSALSASPTQLSYVGAPAMVGVAEGALQSAGARPALLASTGTTGQGDVRFLDEPSRGTGSTDVVIATGGNLSTLAAPSEVLGFGATTGTGSTNQTTSSRGERALPSPFANWTVSVWSLANGSVTTVIPGSHGYGISFSHTGAAATTSLNYLSSLVDGSYRGIHVDPSTLVVFNVTADARQYVGSGASAYLNMVASNSTAKNLVQISSKPAPLGFGWTRLNVSGTFPLDTAYFTLRLFATYSGTLELSNLTIQWRSLGNATGSFSGVEVALPANQSVHVPVSGLSGLYRVMVDVAGTGGLTVRGTNSSTTIPTLGISYSWVETPTVFVSGGFDLLANGTLAVAGVVLWPGALPVSTSGCVLGNVTASSLTTLRADGSLTAGCIVGIHEPFSPHWTLVGDSGAVISSDLFGQTQIRTSSDHTSVTIMLGGVGVFPWLLAGFVAFTVVMGLVILWWPVLSTRFRRALYRRGRQT